MKKIILCLLIFLSVNLFSQKKVYQQDSLFLNSFNKQNQSFALSNQKNGDLFIITTQRKTTKGVLLDSLYNIKSNFEAEPLPNKFKIFTGYTIRQNKCSILFTDEKHSKLGLLEFDTKENSYIEKKLKFKFGKEKYLESIVYNNEVYFLTSSKGSDVNIYKLDKNYKLIKNTVSFEKVAYPRIPNSSIKISASTLFRGIPHSHEYPQNGYIKIESRNPNTIETTSKKIKIYQKENFVLFSFDNNPEKTNLFYVNLDTFELTHKAYPKVSKNRDLYEKNNSYIFDDKLFQIASSNELLNFRVLDLKTDKIIKEFIVKKEDSISFKNSKITQEKKGKLLAAIKFDKSKELEKTSKFLKNISFANLGISVFGIGNNYEVILGGTKNYDPNTGAYIALAVLSAGTLAATSGGVAGLRYNPTPTPYNPSIYNYATYHSARLAEAGTESTFIHCFFDKNINHITGEISPNIFDRIYDFEDTLQKPRAVNIFIHQNKLHYNYLDSENNLFQLYKFDEN